jgi:hypothetical protein
MQGQRARDTIPCAALHGRHAWGREAAGRSAGVVPCLMRLAASLCCLLCRGPPCKARQQDDELLTLTGTAGMRYTRDWLLMRARYSGSMGRAVGYCRGRGPIVAGSTRLLSSFRVCCLVHLVLLVASASDQVVNNSRTIFFMDLRRPCSCRYGSTGAQMEQATRAKHRAPGVSIRAKLCELSLCGHA